MNRPKSDQDVTLTYKRALIFLCRLIWFWPIHKAFRCWPNRRQIWFPGPFLFWAKESSLETRLRVFPLWPSGSRYGAHVTWTHQTTHGHNDRRAKGQKDTPVRYKGRRLRRLGKQPTYTKHGLRNILVSLHDAIRKEGSTNNKSSRFSYLESCFSTNQGVADLSDARVSVPPQ